MKFTVTNTWLEHTGGTKFYQVFQLTPEKGVGKPVTVTHWGKASIADEIFMRPVKGGETQVTPGALGASKISAKLKRGYLQSDQKTWLIAQEEWLTEQFGAELAHTIALEMFGAKGEPTSEPETKAIPKAKAIEPEAPRPEAWGTW
jgi:hypothetical protein